MQSRVALVTGSTSGIGLKIAESLASSGYRVALHGLLPPEQKSDFSRYWQETTKQDMFLAEHDFSKPGKAIDCVEQVLHHFKRLDVLVNNAGIQHVAPVEQFTLESWQRVIQVNLNSGFETIHQALPQMKARGWGRIINIASVHGQVASANKSAYVASKHGLLGLTKTVALEAANTGVTCNAICPGWVRTPLVEKQIQARAQAHGTSIDEASRNLLAEKQPEHQFVDPLDVAQLVLFLLSDHAKAMTGSALTIDGGWTSQ